MSFLYPLFLAGAAAVGLPILLHMIRRHTRRRVAFSSLMFLRTAVPRFKNRKRIEHLPLLVLRCTVLCLLALAFARPFFARPAGEDPVRVGKRIVLLIDTSASMRRTGLWAQAISEAQSVLQSAGSADRVCVMTFDKGTQTVMGFGQWEAMNPRQRASTTVRHLSELSPSWAMTDLGHALVTAAEAIEEAEAGDEQRPLASRRIVLISDVQSGCDLEALAAYEWPGAIEVVVQAVASPRTTNAAPQLMAHRRSWTRSDGEDLPSIRITNSPDATRQHFKVSWDEGTSAGTPDHMQDVYVPPGQSTVLRAPAEVTSSSVRKLVLTGDDHDFDNTVYVAPDTQQQINILYIGGDDPNDAEDMLYYVRQAFDAGALTSRVLYRSGNEMLADDDVEAAHLVIVTDMVTQPNLTFLRQHLESGLPILVVMKSAEAVTTVSGLTGIYSFRSEEADVNRYAMLGQIEFTHPLLVPFSDPRFGDFTQIHFWKYRRVDIASLPNTRVLAWFDSNDPAWFDVAVGNGTLLLWTCGWHPADSDLALSSKFVPLLYSALECGGRLAERKSQYYVGDTVPIPVGTTPGASKLQVRKPDGSLLHLGAGLPTFTETDLPGIYSVTSGAGSHRFAVNLAAKECLTDPMPIENLENLGVSLEPPAHLAEERTQRASQLTSPAEMESRQKLWRWFLLGAMAILLIETWLGGWLVGSGPVSEEERT